MNPFSKLSHKQSLLMSAGIGVGITLFFVLAYQIIQSEPSHEANVKSRDIQLTPPGKTIDKKDVWMSKIEAQTQQQSQKIDLMEKMLQKNAIGVGPTESESLKEEVKRLREDLRNVQLGRMPEASTTDVPWSQGQGSETVPLNPTSSVQGQPQTTGFNQRGVQKIVVNLNNKISKQRHFTNILPAGAFAQAVLIGSVDANCGVSSTSDPKPVLLRLLENGTLPNNFKSKLKRCVAIGASHGDLSSERVYIRLERMSCIEKATGEVIETDVAGYIAGEDGKAGIRGEVVDRSGSMIARAAVGGFFGGISQFMQGSIMNQQLSQLSKETDGKAIFNMDALKQGGVQGVGSALDKLSDYYIKRAEQLQPVIQIAAGRTVDIVFTHGAKIGSQATKDQVRASASGGEE
ncbi:MAG: TraB/VirB10 family protein [Alphaproteobacteria bacterium]|nr:TraB/VirB10 family protein [Alphaproteobacteria bacterium]